MTSVTDLYKELTGLFLSLTLGSMEEFDIPFHERTPCMMYGHDYVPDEDDPQVRRCADCGETYEED